MRGAWPAAALAEAAAALVSAIFFLPWAAPAQAHELGANRVEITVQEDGRYDVAIVTSPAALLARLELLRGDAARATAVLDRGIPFVELASTLSKLRRAVPP